MKTRPIPLSWQENRGFALKKALTDGELVLAPGVFDCLTATIVERAGFSAAYVTGSGISISMLGAPDVGVASPTEVYERVRRICDSVELSVIADADTGYGGPLNVARTVIELERGGVAAIQLEDQEWPKKCGHEPGRRLASVATMTDRIRAAVDARRSDDMLVIARTDARSDLGIDAAIERGQIYLEAGADCIFVESPETEDELSMVSQRIGGWTLANLVEGGRTPLLPASRLAEIGFNIVIYPNALTRLFARMGMQLLEELKASGETKAFHDRMLTHRELWNLFNYGSWTDLERRLTSEPN